MSVEVSDSKNTPALNEDGTNASDILCPFCSLIVLKAGKAPFDVDKQIALHAMTATSPDEPMEDIKGAYSIKDVMTFENVAVMRKINNQQVDISAGFKYLSCADCERGPIGIVYLNDNTYHIAHPRVKYAATSE